jgi:hypothetical protein
MYATAASLHILTIYNRLPVSCVIQSPVETPQLSSLLNSLYLRMFQSLVT